MRHFILPLVLALAALPACEIGVRAKVDSRPSSEVTTDLTHGEDGCDYAHARNGQVTKIPGSCPSDMQGGAR